MNRIFERNLKQVNRERRRFLDMLGKAGVSSSLLRASPLAGGMFASRFAQAQDNQPKLICIYHPNGAPDGAWAPGRSVALNPLNPHASQCAFREVEIRTPGGHGNIQQCMGATSWGNESNGSSYNMQVAKVIGGNTPYSSIELGVVTNNAQGGINYLNGQSVPLEDSPSAALNRIFGSAPPSPGGNVDLTAFDRKLDVIESNRAAIEALRRKLGSDEQSKLQEHLTALADLEKKVEYDRQQAEGGSDNGGGSCSGPSLASGSSPLQQYKAQGDIAVSALKCGLTNVVSIQFNETQASWIAADGTADAVDWQSDHHQANHANGSHVLPDLIEYMNKGVAHIIAKLKQEGLFNNTVVVVVSEMGDGQNHTTPNGPVTVATGRSGLSTGFRQAGGQHLGVFDDVTQLLGLSSSMGGMIHRYGGGGIVV